MLKAVLFVLDGASMPEGTGDYNLKLFINFPELPTTEDAMDQQVE